MVQAHHLYHDVARTAIHQQRPAFTNDEVTRTMWWMWRHADFPKAAFQQAEQANQGRGSVPFPANVILPTRPPTLTEAAGPAKKHGHRQQLPGFQVVVPAQQAAQGNTDPDAFPWAFWPQLPWDRDPDDIYDELRAPDESIARFMRGETQRKDADETGWVGVLSLGQGAYGRAGLWVQIDDSRNITDRMVIKDTKDAEEFFNARFWRDRRPREVKIHQLLEAGRSNGTGFDNVVRFRTYRLMMGHKRLRLFTDYYPGKDMNRSLRPMLKLYHRDGSVEPPSEFWIPLPERFLWEAFRDLVNACLVMQQGDVRDAKKDWKPITHCDLHAANIMLDINESLTGYEFQRQYPRLVVGDFGLSFYNIVDGPGTEISDNPQLYKWYNRWLPRYPPELWEPYNEPINEKADVHAIGNVMWKLITSVDSEDGAYAELTNRQTGLPVLLGSGQYHYDSAGELKEVSEYTLLGHYSYMRHVRAYSETLKQLVRDCLRWIPADRPSLQALRDAIEAQVDQHQKPPQDPNFRWNLNPDGRWSRAGRVEHVRYRLGGQLP